MRRWTTSHGGLGMNNPIVLAGFMGTGKTTVAIALAERLQWAWVDTDALLQARLGGMPVRGVFARYGEPFFRAVEKGICLEVSLWHKHVIATGGGALLDEQTRTWLVERCFVVCLTAKPETIEARLAGETDRPLAGQWRTLLAQRQPIYDSLPYQVATDDKTPLAISEEVVALWQAHTPST